MIVLSPLNLSGRKSSKVLKIQKLICFWAVRNCHYLKGEKNFKWICNNSTKLDLNGLMLEINNFKRQAICGTVN